MSRNCQSVAVAASPDGPVAFARGTVDSACFEGVPAEPCSRIICSSIRAFFVSSVRLRERSSSFASIVSVSLSAVEDLCSLSIDVWAESGRVPTVLVLSRPAPLSPVI